MQQYFEAKQKYPESILLFRVGDFYETFGSDAIKTSQILGIVLTSRNNGGSDIELSGFPHHSLDLYLPKLVKAGYRVAICEQLEKPSKEKKIVKRGVTDVVSPGVTISESLLDGRENNFLASIHVVNDTWSVSFVDVSTGEFLVNQGTLAQLEKLLQSFAPSEIIFSKKQKSKIEELVGENTYLFGLDDWFFDRDFGREQLLEHFNVSSLKGFGIESMEGAHITSGAVLHYLSSTNKTNLSHISSIARIESDEYVWLDKFSIRNLELIRSNHESGIPLINVLDKTITPMGARMLKKWILLPLKSISHIKKRLDIVTYFYQVPEVRAEIGKIMASIGDLERLMSKVPMGKVNPREVVSIKNAMLKIGEIRALDYPGAPMALIDLVLQIELCQDLVKKIDETIIDDPPYSLAKGSVIKDGFDDGLDDLRNTIQNAKDLLLNVQQTEAKKTGITSLKIGFNNVFGYYLEVTNKYKNLGLIPDNWVRKQTLKGSERYITPELKDLEGRILGAEEKINALEEAIYSELVTGMLAHVKAILENSRIIGRIDCLMCAAEVAEKYDYCKPDINDSTDLRIVSGRHPVIEAQLPPDNPYVPNDLTLDKSTQQIIMITGPNMSGKSAVLRQTALICLMAHMGFYVPAERAEIGLVDKIFTRVGASDNISSGESTFMVEMTETSSILNNLSERSLILLDEIGRGTSTYDGISIAWAIAEYLHESPLKPKTLFATHYHELNQLENTFERIKNFNVSTKEVGKKVVFLRKLIPGACESSFGIHVAQMAGMPHAIVAKAQVMLSRLEKKSLSDKQNVREAFAKQARETLQLTFFDTSSPKINGIIEMLNNLDIYSMTPIECMMKLNELVEKLSDD